MLNRIFELFVSIGIIWLIVGQIIQYQIPDESELEMVYGKVQTAQWAETSRGVEYLKIQLIESPYRLTTVSSYVADNPSLFSKDELITVGIYNKEAWHIQVSDHLIQSYAETLEVRKKAYRRQQYFLSLMLTLILLYMANSVRNFLTQES